MKIQNKLETKREHRLIDHAVLQYLVNPFTCLVDVLG